MEQNPGFKDSKKITNTLRMILLRKLTFRLLPLLAFLMVSYSSHAQSDPTGTSAVTSTYAITNATIIPSPGVKIEGGTIIISDGLITEVGTNVNIPNHAQVIDGTDHYVYAGFIDGMSNTGAKRPDAMERPDDLFPPDPPNDYAGITPEISVVEQLDVEDGKIASMRKLGFTISHTVPYGRMLPGKGALILLRDGEHADDLILEQEVSLLSQFSGAPGSYPGNTLGIMAKWRNIYQNAALSKQHAELYASNPIGLNRPSQDRVLKAFYPIVDRSQPVFYNATTLLEAQRAIRLQDEMGFRLVLGNLEQGWALANDLNSNISVFMSLEIPEEPESANESDDSEEVQQLTERRLEFYNRHMNQFDQLTSSGVSFGFSTMGVSASKVKKNIVAMQAFGFDSSEALAALTTNAAELLGISNIAGTLDAGKIGNAVVTTGPYFADGTDVKMVFVDGHKYDFEIKEGGSTEVSDNITSDVLGTWEYSGISPQGEISGTIVFTNETGELTGTISSAQGIYSDVILTNISYREGTLTFDYTVDFGGQSLELILTGEIIGNDLDGEISVPAFNTSFPVSATKKDPNN